MNIKHKRVQNLTEGLCEAMQECYDDGWSVSQEIVQQMAMEMFLEDEVLVNAIHEDDITDFLVDEVIGNISINL